MGAVCGKDSHHKKKTKDNSPEKEKAVFQPSESDIVLGNLMNMRDELLDKKNGLYQSIEKTETQIKAYIKNQKADSAKYIIKCKKLYEEYLKIVEDKYLFTQKMIIEVQKKIMDKSLVEVMKNTNALLKDIQKTMDVDEMREMVENIQENSEKNKELNEMFKKYNANDAEEIDKEYDLIEAQMQMNVIPQPIVNKTNLANNNLIKTEKQPKIQEKKKDDIDERLAELA